MRARGAIALTKLDRVDPQRAAEVEADIAALWQADEDPEKYVDRCGLRQMSDEKQLTQLARRAVAEHPDMVAGYRRGKTNLKQALMGAAMGLSGGMANPAMLRIIMDRVLDGEER